MEMVGNPPQEHFSEEKQSMKVFADDGRMSVKKNLQNKVGYSVRKY